jgi:hypothetical protein
MSGEWVSIVGIIFGTISWMIIVVAFFFWRQRRLQVQAEIQTKLIERFGSSPELVTFLNSQAGRDFVNGVQTGTVTVVRDQVLNSIRRAIVLTFLGLAFLALWMVMDERGLAWPAILLLAVGIGYFVSSYVAVVVGRRLGAGDQRGL